MTGVTGVEMRGSLGKVMIALPERLLTRNQVFFGELSYKSNRIYKPAAVRAPVLHSFLAFLLTRLCTLEIHAN